MSFIEVVDRVTDLLRSRGRISYRVLIREFDLDDEQVEDLKEELIHTTASAISSGSPCPGVRPERDTGQCGMPRCRGHAHG